MLNLGTMVKLEPNSQNFEQIQVEFTPRIIEEMINCINLLVEEFNFAWKDELGGFMVVVKFVEINGLYHILL
jgi:hypothetical protein